MRVFLFIGFILGLSTTFFLLFAWWERGVIQYNESGRYHDGFVVWHEQSEGVYAILALASIFINILMVVFYRKVHRDKAQNKS
jgi:hypothetical protein